MEQEDSALHDRADADQHEVTGDPAVPLGKTPGRQGPAALPAKSAGREGISPAAPGAFSALLEGKETDVGIPASEPPSAQKVPEDQNLFAQWEVREREEQERELDELMRRKEGLVDRLMNAVFGRVAGAVIVLVLGGLLLFITTQAVTFYHQVSTMPLPLRVTGFVLLGALCFAMLWALGYLVTVWLRLRVSPRYAVKALDALRERESLRRLVNSRMVQAKRGLMEFLEDYPLDGQEDFKRLTALGLKEPQVQQLRHNRQWLRERESASVEGWIRDFDREFLGILDKAGKHRIERLAVRVGTLTAILPSGLPDTAAVLINTLQMGADLCTIYNLRMSRVAMVRVLLQSSFGVLAAGTLPQATEDAANILLGSAEGTLKHLKAFGARSAEGFANGMLFWRLGTVMLSRLRPIWPPLKN